MPCVARRLVVWCIRGRAVVEMGWRWAIVTSARGSGDDWRYIRVGLQGHRLKAGKKWVLCLCWQQSRVLRSCRVVVVVGSADLEDGQE